MPCLVPPDTWQLGRLRRSRLWSGVSVASLAMGDRARYGQIATLSAFVAAALCVIAWLLRLSALINFISETVLLGFKAGAGLSIAATVY